MLSETVSGSGMSIYAQVALVIFFLAFVAVVIWVLRRPKREIDRQSRLPLDDDHAPNRTPHAGSKRDE